MSVPLHHLSLICNETSCREYHTTIQCSILSQLLEHAHELEAVAVHHHPLLLMGCVFRGWCRVVREERILMWEKERRAKKHHER